MPRLGKSTTTLPFCPSVETPYNLQFLRVMCLCITFLSSSPPQSCLLPLPLLFLTFSSTCLSPAQSWALALILQIKVGRRFAGA